MPDAESVNRAGAARERGDSAVLATVLLKISAKEGVPRARNNLGLLYYNGQGVPQDYVTAYAWSNIAAAQGDEKAKRIRDLAAAKLGAASLVEAQKLSKEYFKRYVEPFQ